MGHDRIKNCSSLPELIGRHLLVEYCGRHEMEHVPVDEQTALADETRCLSGIYAVEDRGMEV